MKINMKQIYRDLLSHIQFPSFIYYYETNRILGMNDYAKEILGDNVRNIKDIFNVRPKLSNKVLSNGSLILNKKEINSVTGTVSIDMEINVISIDEKHMCIVFFEHSYKQNFKNHLKSEVPRIYWKNKDQNYLGMNESFKNDYGISITNEEMQMLNYGNANFMETEFKTVVDVDEMRVIKGRELLYDMLQVVNTANGENVFIKNNRIPFFNKNSTVLGMLGVYHLVLDREEYKKQYYMAIKDSYEMYEDQVNLNQFYGQLLRMIHSSNEYHLILGAIFDAIVKRFRIDHINIYRYDIKDKDAECIYVWNTKKRLKVGKVRNEIIRELRSIIFRELRKQEYIAINSNEEKEKEKFIKLLEVNNLSALLIFRMDISGDTKTIISFGDSKDRNWTPELIQLLKDISLLVQIVIDRNLLEQEILELKNIDNDYSQENL